MLSESDESNSQESEQALGEEVERLALRASTSSSDVEDTVPPRKRGAPALETYRKYNTKRTAVAKAAAIQLTKFAKWRVSQNVNQHNLDLEEEGRYNWNLQRFEDAVDDINTDRDVFPPSDIGLPVASFYDLTPRRKLDVTIGTHQIGRGPTVVKELHLMVWSKGEAVPGATLKSVRGRNSKNPKILASALLMRRERNEDLEYPEKVATDIAHVFGYLLERAPVKPQELPVSCLWKLRSEAVIRVPNDIFENKLPKVPTWHGASDSLLVRLSGWDPDAGPPDTGEYTHTFSIPLKHINFDIEMEHPNVNRYSMAPTTIEKKFDDSAEDVSKIDPAAYTRARHLALILFVTFHGFIGPQTDFITRVRMLRERYMTRRPHQTGLYNGEPLWKFERGKASGQMVSRQDMIGISVSDAVARDISGLPMIVVASTQNQRIQAPLDTFLNTWMAHNGIAESFRQACISADRTNSRKLCGEPPLPAYCNCNAEQREVEYHTCGCCLKEELCALLELYEDTGTRICHFCKFRLASVTISGGTLFDQGLDSDSLRTQLHALLRTDDKASGISSPLAKRRQLVDQVMARLREEADKDEDGKIRGWKDAYFTGFCQDRDRIFFDERTMSGQHGNPEIASFDAVSQLVYDDECIHNVTCYLMRY